MLGQNLYLNEIVSSNSSSFYDEDGDSPDWIEIHNASNNSINLIDFGLSDDYEDPYKWKFPSYTIQPNDYSIILASDKDRVNIIQNWDAILDIGDTWSYWIGNSEPINNWEQPYTDVSNWPIGQSGFGYGDNDDNTIVNQTISIYVRTNFFIDELSNISKVLFHLDFDDGYIAYINGVEFSRENLGLPGTNTSYNTTATALHEAEIYSGGFPNAFVIDPDLFPIYPGQNTIAIEVHNYSSSSSDLSCIPFLTFGYNTDVSDIRNPDERMILPDSFLHTNFKISSSGENIILSNSSNEIIDSIFTGQLDTDMSFGRIPNEINWALFSETTPGEANTTPSFLGSLQKPTFSIQSGFYDDEQALFIAQEHPIATTHYTLDGSVPDRLDPTYSSPIYVSENSVIRAKSFLEGWAPSKTESKTYIIGEEYPEGIPVFFLTTDSNSFFHEDTGMYAMGPNASNDFPHFGANFWEDWERPIHFEILDPNNEGYSADAGVKIFGGWSRGFPQKSLSFFSRSSIGTSSFDYALFPDSNIENYEAFVLRNSGNDWESTMLRDGFITSLTDNLDIDHQEYRPSILYINGQFWGIQNIREKVNEHFIASNHNINPDHIDLLAGNGGEVNNGYLEIVNGTRTDYQNLIEYIESNNMNDVIVQNALENWIDIDSFLSYHAFQIFIDNRDWPGNNIKFWRDRRPGGKWRWILYDTDFGFGIWQSNAYAFNTLDFALEENGPGWPNPPWSTLIFRKIIANDHFKSRFISIYCDLLNTTFKPDNLTNHLDSIRSNIEDIIPRHRNKWFNNGWWPNSAVNWESRLNNIYNFSQNRSNFARSHIQSQFGLDSMVEVTINIQPQNSGSLHLNSLKIIDNQWTGLYFPNIISEVSAIPNSGYEFSHWQEYPDSGSIMQLSSIPGNLTAIFTESNLSPGEIVINEINYNSNSDHDTGDWVELINKGQSTLDLSNWVLKDDDDSHSFIFPEGTVLGENEYLIISQDQNLFSSFHSSVNNLLGPMDFGLSGGGDQIRVYDRFGSLIDSVEYDDNEPWPNSPDGNGHTLELVNLDLDNALANSWAGSLNLYGSPGIQNSSYLTNMEESNSFPNNYKILSPYPNPFNGYVNIPIMISGLFNEKLMISNIKGEVVKVIPLNNITPGLQNLNWNGTNEKGFNVSTGIYFLTLQNSKNNLYQKVLYLK